MRVSIFGPLEGYIDFSVYQSVVLHQLTVTHFRARGENFCLCSVHLQDPEYLRVQSLQDQVILWGHVRVRG